MTNFTRRTHIVRVSDPNNAQRYVDVEVLDAVAFRGPDGKSMVFNCPATAAAPYVRDDTGDGETISPAVPTRASHMERVTNPDDSTQFLDIEVLDSISFVTPNGEKWVLDMPMKNAHVYITDDTGDGTSGVEGGGDPTRSMTIKKVENPTNPTQFIKVARPDSIAFRKANGEKLIIYAPDKTAVPSTRPPGYQPDDASQVPPENVDPNPYIRWPKDGTGGPWLGKARVKQGPLWWIRAAKSQSNIGALLFSFETVGKADHDFSALLNCPALGIRNVQLSSLSPIRPPKKIAADPYWVYAPVLKSTTTVDVQTFTVIDSASYFVQTSHGLVTSAHVFGAPDIPVTILAGDTTNYPLIWYNEFEPLNSPFTPFGVIDQIFASHTVTDTVTTHTKKGEFIVFFNIGSVPQPAAPAEPVPLAFTVTTIGADSHTSLKLNALFFTYKNTVEFPVNSDNVFIPQFPSGQPGDPGYVPPFPGDGDPVDAINLSPITHTESATPPYQFSISVNPKTLKITGSRTSL